MPAQNMKAKGSLTRRDVCKAGLGLLAAPALSYAQPAAASRPTFKFRYIVASSLYGRLKLADILPEVQRAGAEHIDIWPEKHANQREQIDEMGHDAFAAMMKKHGVRLGAISRYDLGPFGLQDEMKVLRKLGGKTIVCGGQGPRGLAGDELKAAVRQFAEQMKPHVAAAEALGVTIAIENHGANLIELPDSMRWLVEFVPSKNLAIALAPYHLPQVPEAIGKLIGDLGPRLAYFYAWQHGDGCGADVAGDRLMLQMPGRGPMDFTPIVAALSKIEYIGWVGVFMHPVPRGVPIRPTATEVTAEINLARAYLEKCLSNVRSVSSRRM